MHGTCHRRTSRVLSGHISASAVAKESTAPARSGCRCVDKCQRTPSDTPAERPSRVSGPGGRCIWPSGRCMTGSYVIPDFTAPISANYTPPGTGDVTVRDQWPPMTSWSADNRRRWRFSRGQLAFFLTFFNHCWPLPRKHL